ncbi:MAG: TIGR04086 family membrane protein [Firmicutes bacterium]|jgi:putative membrane protein (TIGR04086 family)|nr:TIGR04086 family membrane protein [Bacillota bacterium]
MRSMSPSQASARAHIPTWRTVLAGFGVSLATTLVLSAIGGIVMTVVTVDAATVDAAVPVIAYLSAGMGGLYASRLAGEKGGRNGLLVGIVYLAAVLAVSAAVIREPISMEVLGTKGGAILLVALVGGIIGVNV